jgi:hypothetical protein
MTKNFLGITMRNACIWCRITREQIASQIRNPIYSWSQRVRFLNYGASAVPSFRLSVFNR